MMGSDPAFPIGLTERWDERGLTKRELFAMVAMQGMLSSWPADSKFYPEHTAQRAIEFADALIAELAK